MKEGLKISISFSFLIMVCLFFLVRLLKATSAAFAFVNITI